MNYMRMRLHHKKWVHYVVSGLFLVALAVAMGAGIGNNEPKQIKAQLDKAVMPAIKVVVKENGTQEVWTRIKRVVDGDTFAIDIRGKEEKVRLIGMDTPEVVDPRKPVQCFGREASSKAKELLSEVYVRLESDATQSDRDKYGRLLRYAFMEDGTFFNEYMVKEGYAHEYTYQIPYKYQKQFKAAQTYARENKKGLWANGVCEGSS